MTAAAITASIAGRSSGASVSLYADAYVIQEGGQFFSVIDLYADLPSPQWQVASVAGDVSLLGGSTWFHDDTSGSSPSGGTWLPAVASVTHPIADSFVTIGLPLFGLPNATVLAPTFVNDPPGSSFLGTNAGWANGFPPGFQGYATDIALHDGSSLRSATMLGRFSIAGIPTNGATLKLESFVVAYNFASTPPQWAVFDQATFAYVPTPATLGVLPAFLCCGRRRRVGRGPTVHSCIGAWANEPHADGPLPAAVDETTAPGSKATATSRPRSLSPTPRA